MRIRVEGEIAREADLLIASTSDEGEELVNSYGASPDRVFIVPPGVDLATFRPLDRVEARHKIGYSGGPLLLFVGRLERLKGVEIAIRALALLKGRAYPDLRLLVVGEDSRDGDESEKDRLMSVASSLAVRDHVDFLGSVAHHELPYFYSAADACIMPSYSESFGLVALEAQACGTPVVASGVPGLRSVVRDRRSGGVRRSYRALACGSRACPADGAAWQPARAAVLVDAHSRPARGAVRSRCRSGSDRATPDQRRPRLESGPSRRPA